MGNPKMQKSEINYIIRKIYIHNNDVDEYIVAQSILY